MRFGPIALATVLGGCRASITSVGEYHAAGGARDAAADVAPEPDAAPPAFYLEAESGELTGFTVERDGATSGGAYITGPLGVESLDVPGAARAVYRFDVPESAMFTIWGRIHSPDTEHNALWVRVDDGSWYVWRLSTGEDWYWGSFHDNMNYGIPLRFDLVAGGHELDVANYADIVGLDRLYFTGGGDTPPGNDTPCHPPDSVRLAGACVPSCGSHGNTTCGADVCAGRVALAAYDCDVCCAAQ
jgi:hypothetical protein